MSNTEYQDIEPAFVQNNKDDLHGAIDALDTFTKSWCMDVKATEALGDLCFRCKKCEFLRKEDNVCLIKNFAYNHDSAYTDSLCFGAISF